MVRFCLLLVVVCLTCTPMHAAGDASLQAMLPTHSLEDKAVAPTEDLTLDPSVVVDSSVPQAIKDALWKQLHVKELDWANALVVLIVGLMMVHKSAVVLDWIIVGAVFVVVYLLAANELQSTDELTGLKRFEAVEIAALGAWIAYKGIPGIQLLIGGALGYACAQQAELMLIMHGYNASDLNPYGIALMYSLIVLFFVFAFSSKYHLQIWAVISSFIGGSFLAAAIQYFLTLTTFGQSYGLTPKKGAFVEFLCLLYNTGSDANDVGIYAGSKYNQWTASLPGDHEATTRPFCMDQFVGRVIWFLFFVYGSVVQIKKVRAQAAKVGTLEPLLPQ